MKVLAYIVIFQKGESALFLNKNAAEDFAVKHHGIVEPMVSLKDALANREDKSLD